MSQVLTNRKAILSFIQLSSRANNSSFRSLHIKSHLQRSFLIPKDVNLATCLPSLSHTRTQSTSSKIEHVQIAPFEGETTSKAVSFFADSPITHVLEDALISCHDLCSFEWSTMIILAAFTFRVTLCVPIKIYQERLIARLINIQPSVNEAVESKLRHMQKGSAFLSPQMKMKIARQVDKHFD
jgi:hypothetical protein